MFAIVALAGAYTLATQHFSHPVSVTVNLPSAVNVSDWKTFESRGGWSIRYPPDWKFSSCHTCTDPSDAGLFVTFDDPRTDDAVMVEPIDGPHTQDLNAWFSDVKVNANQNRIVAETPTSVAGKPALKVLYRYADASEDEVFFVADAGKGYEIIGENSRQPGYVYSVAMISTMQFHDTGAR